MKISEDLALEYYLQKMSDREMARMFNCHHNAVGQWRRKHDLPPNRTVRQGVDMVDDGRARCRKCFLVKELSNFKIQRSNAKYPYRLGYCTLCRSQQQYANQNNSLSKYFRDRLRRIKVRAAANGIPFNLTESFLADLWKEQHGRCFYSGWTLRTEVGSGYADNAFSVDRVLPEKGYTFDNVVLCCYKVNSVKSNLSLSLLREWIPSWYQKIMNRFPEMREAA